MVQLSLSLQKINKKILITGLIVILILAIIGVYFWLVKAGKISQIDLGLLLAGLTQRKTSELEKEAATAGELEINLPSSLSQGKIYEEVAEKGQGITHLARKALKEYLAENQANFNLTPEHKIYIEDYLQKKTGNQWLKIGEKVSFSSELILEAINKAQQLTPQQLENLTQYSNLVPNL